jgi:HEAT repeat protein
MEQELLADLASPDLEIRREAITRASNHPTDAIRARLVEILNDPQQGDAARQAAAEALGRMPAEFGSRPLIDALGEAEPQIRTFAAIGLALCPCPDAVVPLVHALKDKVNTVRNVAERALIEQIELVRQHGVEALIETAAHPVPLTRSPAARLLGLTQDPRGFASLARMLTQDKQWLARMWAAKGLGDLQNPEAIALLRDSLQSDEKNRVRAAAAEALGKLRPEGGDEWLLRAAEEDEDGGVRKMASEALRLYGIDLPDEETDDPLDDLAERSQ